MKKGHRHNRIFLALSVTKKLDHNNLCFLGLRQGSGDGARGETILLAAGTEGGPDGDRPPYGEYKGQPWMEADAAGV